MDTPRGNLKDLKYGEGWCQFANEKVMFCHSCTGKLTCWNASIAPSKENLLMDALQDVIEIIEE